MGEAEFKIVFRGYERTEVDALLQQVRRGHPVDVDPSQSFTIGLRGYDRAEVDAFCSQLR